MKKIVVLIVLATILFSCKKDEAGCLLIRIENISDFKYNNILVNTGGGEKDYGKLASGKKSVYKSFESAYQYAYVEFEADGEIYKIQPFDYVGETPLANGKYTYQLYLNEFGESSLMFVED